MMCLRSSKPSLKEIARDLILEDETLYLAFDHYYQDRYRGALLDNFLYDIYLKDGHRLIGFCDLRIGDEKALLYLGNIGYNIYGPYRGHHYAFKATCLLYQLGKALGLSQVSITCNPDNFASLKTIEKSRACYLKTVDVDPKDPLYWQGDRQKHIYIKRLDEEGK